jgi:hypothetical protein
MGNNPERLDTGRRLQRLCDWKMPVRLGPMGKGVAEGAILGGNAATLAETG